MAINIDTSAIKSIAQKAGELILEIYTKDEYFESIEQKKDDSPLTIADKRSNEYIVREIKKLYPDIPIISEEGKDISYDERKNWPLFWLIDPLDGTKEFIKRNGQFTVNIALVENKAPVFGLIYAPVPGAMYYTENGQAYVEKAGGERQRLKVNNKKDNFTAVRSSSHAAPEEEELFKEYGVVDFASKGSSLKFCMIAEGSADIYYRHKPTMEWDTAAGQAIVEAAGGKVLQGTSDKRFLYNKTSLVNGSFLCLGRE